jgi:hypothetical protein
MTIQFIEEETYQAQSFIEFVRTLPFVKSVEKFVTQAVKDIYREVEACNATSVDVFFDELDNRIKKRYGNV